MPLPLLFIGIAAVSGLAGVGKGVKAGIDNSQAKSINKSANKRIESASRKLDKNRQQCGDSLDALGREKIFVLNGSIKLFLDSFEKIKNVDFTKSEGLDELNKFHIDKKTFGELKEMENFATSLIEGSVAGVASGAFAAFGAYSAATTLATASTGTAIASLSGVAATNATLAFFGGGSLAAGGLGMAGGAAVLGGLVAGPALLVMGLIIGGKAGKNLEEAKANSAKADTICEQLETGSTQCIAIRRRTYMFYSLLARLDAYFMPLIYKMEEIIEKEGVDYSVYSEESKKVIVGAASVAGTIKAILDIAILTEAGELTEESEMMMKEIISEIDQKADNR